MILHFLYFDVHCAYMNIDLHYKCNTLSAKNHVKICNACKILNTRFCLFLQLLKKPKPILVGFYLILHLLAHFCIFCMIYLVTNYKQRFWQQHYYLLCLCCCHKMAICQVLVMLYFRTSINST